MSGVIVDVRGANAAGRALSAVARQFPREFSRAMGLQVRNVQRSMTATVRNYAIRSRVDGRTRTLVKFPPRHKITVALHGKASRSVLTQVSSVGVTASGSALTVGFRGGLARYASRWQTGGATNFAEGRSDAKQALFALHRDELKALEGDREFRAEVYRRFGSRYNIHDRAQLGAVMAGNVAAFRAIALTAGLERIGASYADLPQRWDGRPFVDRMAADLRERFAPSLARILDKILAAKIKPRPAE